MCACVNTLDCGELVQVKDVQVSEIKRSVCVHENLTAKGASIDPITLRYGSSDAKLAHFPSPQASCYRLQCRTNHSTKHSVIERSIDRSISPFLCHTYIAFLCFRPDSTTLAFLPQIVHFGFTL